MSTRSATLRFGTGLTAAVALLALTACRATQAASPGGPPPAPPDVSVITVAPEHVALTSEWIATLDGYVNAQIHPQVSGYLITRSYREGAAVHKGDVLFEIDPRPLNAVLTQATAQVAQAEAQLAKSARDVERDTPLAAQQAIAQSQLDAEVQAYRAAEANVQSLKAAVETARLNVGFTNVTSVTVARPSLSRNCLVNSATRSERRSSHRDQRARRGTGQDSRDWWQLNRPKAPGAIRAELERASSLIAFQPHIGTRARNIALPGVRRLRLGRIRYDLYYRLAETPRRLQILAFWHASRGRQPPI